MRAHALKLVNQELGARSSSQPSGPLLSSSSRSACSARIRVSSMPGT
jgi:hypothetical protein